LGDVSNFFQRTGKKITDDQWIISIMKEGYKLEFLKKTSWLRYKRNFSIFQKYRYFTRRNRYFNSKRCNRTCSPTGSSLRFLQYIFSGSEEERKNETCNKFETPSISRKLISKWTL
jgi:hypothetical protein